MFKHKKGKNPLPDEEIVRRILQGEDHLQDELYKRYAGKIYRKCVSVFKDKHLAKDIAHDIIIKVFAKLNQYKGKSEFSFWIYAITYNHCMTHVRNRKKDRDKFKELDNMKIKPVSTEEIELENKVLQDIQLNQLELAMERLPENDRIILLMRYQDKLTVDQIAAALNIGLSAVKMRLKRSRDNLAKQIKTLVDNGQ